MDKRGARWIGIITLTTAVLALWGCSKKETPAEPNKAATATDAVQEKQAEATDTTGQGQGTPFVNAGSLMASVDKNGDGKVTKEEYGVIWKDKAVAERNFNKIDRNGDGVLTAEEFSPKMGKK
jgi:hypothetical protein